MPSDMVRRANLEPWSIDDRYKRSLPPELETAYAYISDCGHSIIVLIDDIVPTGANVDDYLLPVPVRLVLALGYRVDDAGYVHINMGLGMSYTPKYGLEIPEGYDEW